MRKHDPRLTALEPGPASRDERRFWRSLDELADTPEFRRYLEAEFPHLADATRTDRRGLLKLMGASLALAGLAACDRAPDDPIVSRGWSVPGYTPGVPLQFASTLTLNGYGLGVLVTSFDGRPTKIEGNRLHPASLGATDIFAQAAILSLYDPDRSLLPRIAGRRGRPEDVERALAEAVADLEARGGEGLRILTGTVTSPSLAALLAQVLERLPGARWHQYDPVGNEHGYEGTRLAFGEALETRYDTAQAAVILALDADFLGPGGHIPYAAGFAARRRNPAEGLNRLYVVESSPSPTGARADHRIALPPDGIGRFAFDLAGVLGVGPGGDAPHPMIAELARDLRQAGPNALVITGRRQPPEVHALAHAINATLGAVGTTVGYSDPVPVDPADGARSLRALAADMAEGAVSHLVILDANPVYDAPADLGFAEGLARVPFSLHLGLYNNETGAACRHHLPMAHTLESWGDARAFDGTASLIQPVIAPRHDGWTAQQLLTVLAGRPASAHDAVQEFWRARHGGGDFDAFWRQALHDGVISGTALPTRPMALAEGWSPAPPPVSGDGVAVVFDPDPSIWDGRFANNAWLQELPKPLTKLVWDNAVLMAAATAAELEVSNGDVVTIDLHGRSVSGPVWTVPGHAPGCVTLPLGYGRWRAGLIGSGRGFSAYAVRRSEAPWVDHGAVLEPTGDSYRLVTTQQHGTMTGSDPVRAATLAEFQADPHFAQQPVEEQPSIYPEWAYESYAWGMVIDQNACVGCNACVVACQAENNVPVVGKEEVARNREMHWLRIDRYYEGPPEEPATYFQPMLCMHCEKAPCEVVCPVNATVHDSEGLNVMVYNRCIGTRYCSNNCPYKVRRFNWFDYQAEPLTRPAESYNPEVTVRERGVMEKCTYCIQRISSGRIEAKQEGRRILDGEVVTACQQACPTQAIVFGDLNDPDSAVSRMRASPLNYALLGELNTQPRTTYLARVDNPAADDPERS